MNFQLWRIFENEVVDGRYHLNRLLGAGQFGGVYLANEGIGDRWLRQVAVKLIERSTGKGEDRQWREVQASQFDHPRLLRILTAGFCQLQINKKPCDFLYLVTDLAQESLSDRLERGPLLPDEAREVVLSLADAMAFLHGQSPALVHRDIKPANIFKVNGVWKLGDFGLLRIANKENTPTLTGGFGTPAYAAPESYENRVIPPWDMWSLGMVLVEALTGRLPFAFETPEAWQKEVTNRDKAVPVPSLPEPFFSIARGCLEKDERKRWSALGVMKTLQGGIRAEPLCSSSITNLLDRNIRQYPLDNRASHYQDAKILIKYKNIIRQEYLLHAPIVTIGRSLTCDICLEYLAVSRNHCQIVRDGDQYIIEDLNSNNGTYLNGNKIERHTLKHNDFIDVGKHTIVFIDTSDVDLAKICVVIIKNREGMLYMYPLYNPITAIGRSPTDNDIVLDNISVNRNHCQIVRNGHQYIIEDLNSSNGTYVNGNKITDHILQANDVINVGNYTLDFSDSRLTARL